MQRTTIACLTAGLVATALAAAPPVSNGAVVRIQSSAIEGGWHQGRLHLDAQKCWMVKLDKPTRDQYTMLALIAVTQIEVTSNGTWQPVGLRSVLQAQPNVCSEYVND
ncbi:hypothetical protein [Povalibacter sp.]|uniref:hypothetical protein n=1 Tax=Povalibacter sp. TaxID=1962978 RepID=UPI002F412D10